MRKFYISLLFFCVCLGVIGYIVVMKSPHRPDPAPAIVTKTRLRAIADASQAFHTDYDLWPTSFTQFYPDHNIHHIAFLSGGSATTNDGWGHPLIYKPFDDSIGYGSVICLGRDGRSDIEERFK